MVWIEKICQESTVRHHSASLVMPISDPRDRYFYSHHTPMKDTYFIIIQHKLSYILFQLYEEEKSEKERLKRDLEQCKKELREAKAELDRQLKRNDANRVSETNDKRVRPCVLMSL